MLRVEDAFQPFDDARICLLITTLHSVVTQITPSSLAIIKFLYGRSQYCTTSGVPPPQIISGVFFFFSLDRAVGPFLDELGSTCAVTCLAESQPNGLFVITPVSLSLNNKYLKFRLTLQRTITGADIVGALVPHTIG